MERAFIDRQARRDAHNDALKKITEELKKEEVDLHYLSDLHDVFDDKREQLAQSDSNLLEEMLNETCTTDEYKREVLSIEAIKDEALLLSNKVKRKLGLRREWESDDSRSSTLNLSGRASGGERSCKLPKLELPQFAGELRDWMPFWGQFLKIDEDESINDADKLHYLRQSTVEGSLARDIVNMFPMTAANYKNVVESLHERFGREDLLVQVYVRDLIGLVITNIRSKEMDSVSGLYVKLAAHLRALEALKVTKDKCAAIIYPLVESCLPDETLRTWERTRTQFRGNTSEDELGNLMKFLQNEARGEEHMKLARSGFGSSSTISHPPKQRGRFHYEKPRVASAAGLLVYRESGKFRKECIFCSGSHNSQECGKATRLSLQQKKDMIKRSGKCFICFRGSHTAAVCKSFVSCVICSGRHHAILCPNTRLQKGSEDKKPKLGAETAVPSTSTMINKCSTSSVVQLQTLLVKLDGPSGLTTVRALIDTGSQRSYVTEELAKMCKLKKVGNEQVIHKLFGGVQSTLKNHGRYSVTFCNPNGSGQQDLVVSDIPKIADKISTVPKGPWITALQQMGVIISDYNHSYSDIDVLFGADVAGDLLTGKKVELASGPVAVETTLGWTLMGQFIMEPSGNTMSSKTHLSFMNMEDNVANMWSLDILGITDPAEKQSQLELAKPAVEHFEQTVVRLSNGRYEVRLPWVSGHPPLPSLKSVAMKRLVNVKRKLVQDGKLALYDQIFKEWERHGIIEFVPADDVDKPAYYMPHRPVYKPSSLTTPIRPVFDASARCAGGPSLNDCLEKGLNMLELIPDILLRFWLKRVGVVADVKKAFLQMSVAERDRDFLRFLWYNDLKTDEIKEFRHCRVVFGVTSSPFLLASTFRHHLTRVPPGLKETADLLLNSLYVDNCVLSLSSEHEANVFQQQSNQLMEDAKFELRGWEVGYRKTAENVPVLGMIWIPAEDCLAWEIKEVKIEGPITKRKILSMAHRVFDPIGVTCPFTIVPKILLQRICKLKLTWDQEVPEELADTFTKWVNHVEELRELRLPRWVNNSETDVRNWTLHVFTDASGSAYAAVVYLRVYTPNLVQISLLQAKARVSPMKSVSIPRLELIACCIGARLAQNIINTLGLGEIPIYYWSDSTTAISWIQTDHVWATFVNNRVAEIRKISDPKMWRHVPGIFNPADFPSRGGTVQQLKQSTWWEGPCWLKSEPSFWPQQEFVSDPYEVDKEKRKTVVSCMVVEEDAWYLKRFSDFYKLISVVGWIRRFSQNTKQEDAKKRNFGKPLSAMEIKEAEKMVIRLIQQQSYSGVDDKKISSLRPYIDEDELLRIETKILMSDEPQQVKRPYLFPGHHVLVKRLILWHHLNSSHSGVQTLQVKLRDNFWITNSRRAVRSVVKGCQRCRRFAAKKMVCVTPPLPKDRVKCTRIFEVVGVDMAGPLFLRDGEKEWIALFTCAVFRAVHLEITTSLSSDGFIQVLRRFISRREVNWERVEQYTTKIKIEWSFNPPTASWWGGFWERLVGVVKRTLRIVLGKARLTFEELSTVLCETESVVNHRPLTYVSEDAQDMTPLTPAMFLEELPDATLPEADISEASSLSRRLRYRKVIRDALKSRFRKEYISQLVNRGKSVQVDQVKVGDVVLVGNDAQKRIEWPMGRVEEIFSGRDGHRRTVRVKTANGYLLRPIQRLFKLEVNDEVNNTIIETNQDGSERVFTRYGRQVKAPDRLMLFNNCLSLK